MAKNNNKIDSTQLLSVNAEVIDQMDLMRHVAISRWSIDRNCVTYQKDDSHTLSVYIEGGETSYRTDQAANKGAPGKLCLMPQGHNSDWHINGKIEFLHLYFTDQILKQFAASHYDMDVRRIELCDTTYSDDKALRLKLADYVKRCSSREYPSALFAEQSLYNLFDHLITKYNGFQVHSSPINGGLSPHHMKTVKSAITDKLHSKISIAELATEVGLSPFHFARMFKLSFGETPADFITRTRIKKVKELLPSKLSLADISLRTGFSQQSHMTDKFKKHTGITPAAYRREYQTAA